MIPVLRILEEWTTHQDYLWFLALLAWGGVLGGEWRRKADAGVVAPRYWLMIVALSGMSAALLELVLLAQDIDVPYVRLDFAMGSVQAIGTAALIWAATIGKRHAHLWRAVVFIVVAGAAAARISAPAEAGFVLYLLHVLALLQLVFQRPRPFGLMAAVLLAILPLVATCGPWAYAIEHGRRTTDWSYFSLPAAGTLLGAGAVLAAEVWRRRLRQVMPETPAAAAALQRDLRRALVVLGAWLAGGVLVAVWYGRHARQAFEENLLRRMETAVLAVDRELLVDAFSPALRVEGVEQRKFADGTPVAVARTPRTRDPVFANLRGQLARIREQNNDFHLFYITAWRQGYLLEFASERRVQAEPASRVVNRSVAPPDLLRLAARESFLEGPHRRRWGPAFSAQAPLRHPVTGSVIGWLVADVEATRWLVTFTQARLQTMALIGAGVGMWSLAVAYRLRRESRDAAEQRAAAAAAADRMKSAFLAKVSHELRTPIQSVLGYGEMLAHAPLSDAHRSWLNALRSHGDIMLRLVNDLIDLGALQSGAFQLEIGSVQLRAVIDECAAALRPAAAERGLGLHIEIAPDVPDWVAADSVRLRQILLNLLSNAVKFTRDGAVSLTVRRSGESLEFVVSDSGPGIPEGLRARLFQPFTRLDPASGGSGLGLALVHGLVSAMGGTVRLAEGTDRGATFTVTLPLPERRAATPGTFATPNLRSLAGLRVVVAEDNTLVRELLVAFLTENGASVFAASDGPSALELAREKSPDVMLLDIALPELDGIEVAKALRQVAGLSLKIIGLSAHAGPHDESRARAAGMDEFFTKPVSLPRLAETLARRPRAEPRVSARFKILDDRLRVRLASDFTTETPRLLDEMHAALAGRDWPRLRSHAHYLKNSADVLGVVPLQDACRQLALFDDASSPTAVRDLLDAVARAVPEKAVVLEGASAADA